MTSPLLTDDALRAGRDAMIVTEGGERWIDTDPDRIIAAFLSFHANGGRDELVKHVATAIADHMRGDYDPPTHATTAEAIVFALLGDPA